MLINYENDLKMLLKQYEDTFQSIILSSDNASKQNYRLQHLYRDFRDAYNQLRLNYSVSKPEEEEVKNLKQQISNSVTEQINKIINDLPLLEQIYGQTWIKASSPTYIRLFIALEAYLASSCNSPLFMISMPEVAIALADQAIIDSEDCKILKDYLIKECSRYINNNINQISVNNSNNTSPIMSNIAKLTKFLNKPSQIKVFVSCMNQLRDLEHITEYNDKFDKVAEALWAVLQHKKTPPMLKIIIIKIFLEHKASFFKGYWKKCNIYPAKDEALEVLIEDLYSTFPIPALPLHIAMNMKDTESDSESESKKMLKEWRVHLNLCKQLSLLLQLKPNADRCVRSRLLTIDLQENPASIISLNLSDLDSVKELTEVLRLAPNLKFLNLRSRDLPLGTDFTNLCDLIKNAPQLKAVRLDWVHLSEKFSEEQIKLLHASIQNNVSIKSNLHYIAGAIFGILYSYQIPFEVAHLIAQFLPADSARLSEVNKKSYESAKAKSALTFFNDPPTQEEKCNEVIHS